jgi:cytochrome P450
MERTLVGLEGDIASLVEELIAGFPAQLFDFGNRFAEPLPMIIIADQLGLTQDQHADFKRWTDASVDMADPGRSPEKLLDDARTAIEMRTFFCGEFRRVRERPGDTLLSALANTEVDGGELLSENELSYLLQILLSAGNETTTRAIGSAMLRLVQDHELQTQLRADHGLIPAFVKEVLRLDAPLQGLFRVAKHDTSIGEVEIPQGPLSTSGWAPAIAIRVNTSALARSISAAADRRILPSVSASITASAASWHARNCGSRTKSWRPPRHLSFSPMCRTQWFPGRISSYTDRGG